MNRLLVCLVAVLGLAACQYEEPIGAAVGAKAPAEVAGRWKLPGDPATADHKKDAFLVIHRTTEQRLVVDYEFEPGKHWYFSGHPVLAKHPEFVELEFLGDSEGRQNPDKRFVLVQWKRDGETLAWSVVDDAKLAQGKGGAKLRKALQAALDGHQPVSRDDKLRFTRIVPPES